MPTVIPKAGSPGEDALALHLRAERIPHERQVRLIAGRKWAWDFVIGDIAVEVHGGTWIRGAHSRGAGQARDYEKANAAVKAGYRVLAYSTEMVMAGTAIDDILAMRRTSPAQT